MRHFRVVLLLFTAACNSDAFGVTHPADAGGAWNLRTIGGQPLPVTIQLLTAEDSLVVLRSVLTLYADGSYSEIASGRLVSSGAPDTVRDGGTWESGLNETDVIFLTTIYGPSARLG